MPPRCPGDKTRRWNRRTALPRPSIGLEGWEAGMRICKIIWLIVASLFFLQPTRGQEARSTILGRITDPTGGLIVGATVEATNTDTGVRSTAQTNASGDFLLPFLIPGPYSLTVEAPGFKKSVRSQLQTRVNDRITIDMSLE